MTNDIKSQFIVSDSSTPDQTSAWAEKAIKYAKKNARTKKISTVIQKGDGKKVNGRKINFP